MNTAHLVRRALALVFLGALIVGGIGFYLALKARALDEAAAETRVLLSAASAVREYTVTNIRPQLEELGDASFRPETVPSFAAQSIFRQVSDHNTAYTYREVALNPTNPADLPVPFETALINRFRNEATLGELSGTWTVDGRALFYVAQPISINSEACLACHSTPDRAPAVMLAQYGSSNGFGWQLGETVGIQIITVPIEAEMRGAYELVLMMSAGLMLIFILAYSLLSTTIHRHLVQPLQALSRAADDASVGADSGEAVPETGANELRELARAINRLRMSLLKALRDDKDQDDD